MKVMPITHVEIMKVHTIFSEVWIMVVQNKIIQEIEMRFSNSWVGIVMMVHFVINTMMVIVRRTKKLKSQ
jgi:hypothetical protein